MRCVIFASSSIRDYDFIGSYLRPDDFIICADGGYRHMEPLKRKPDLLVGDFDSHLKDLPNDIETIRVKVEKDETDTMLAADIALSRGYREILILGGLGGRFDHSLANLGLLYYIVQKGGRGILVDEQNEISLHVEGVLKIPRRNGYKVSLFPLGNEVESITLKGLKYPLNHYHLVKEYSIGISNEFAEDVATIETQGGILIVVLSKD